VTGFLLDTNVVSELRKGRRANAHVRAWLESVDTESIFLSVLVTGEIRRGIEASRARDPDAAAALDRWLGALVRAYEGRILPVDAAVADAWGRIDAAGRLPAVDGLLAATARVHDLVLVTRNVRDVRRSGVAVLDPFEQAAT
jgi:predicted nucleic acid-binding protein